jgi:hypothetical protein
MRDLSHALLLTRKTQCEFHYTIRIISYRGPGRRREAKSIILPPEAQVKAILR